MYTHMCGTCGAFLNNTTGYCYNCSTKPVVKDMSTTDYTLLQILVELKKITAHLEKETTNLKT